MKRHENGTEGTEGASSRLWTWGRRTSCCSTPSRRTRQLRPRGRGYPLSARQSVRTNGALRAALCATVVRILALRPDRSPARTSLRSVYVGLRPRSGSLRESHLSPHVSKPDAASHSPRQNALPQARKPRRQAIPSLLPCDCRLLRAREAACAAASRGICVSGQGRFKGNARAKPRARRARQAEGRAAESLSRAPADRPSPR